MNQIKIPIQGMHCASCEVLIGEKLRILPGVKEVRVNHRQGQAELYYSGSCPTDAQIVNAVRDAGYTVGKHKKLPWFSRDKKDYKDLLVAGVILFLLYSLARSLNLFSLNVAAAPVGVLVALVVGLVAGVSTCMALVGGLVLGLSARHAKLHPEATPMQKFRPHLYFNFGRIVGYFVLGGVAGLVGKAFNLSLNSLGFVTMGIAVVMIVFGLKLIEIFPALKNKSITLPSGIARILGIGKEIKEYSHKSAMTMGVLTFFVPCGFTQAMQLYAVSTGSFWQGAMIMGLFAVGTAPGLLGIAGLSAVFRGRRARLFYMVTGLALILLGWNNLTNGGQLIGGNFAITNQAEAKNIQIVKMTQNNNGYSPNTFTVEAGKQVKWIINSTTPFSCAASIVMPKYGISQSLAKGENIIYFTPAEPGEISFSCSMGMYRGKFIVVKGSGANSGVYNTASASPNPAFSGGINATYTYDRDIQPNNFTVKVNQPVKFVLDVKENGYGCMSTVVVPGLYEQFERLIAGQTVIMSFTPSVIGKFPITCAMGVPRGVINVI